MSHVRTLGSSVLHMTYFWISVAVTVLCKYLGVPEDAVCGSVTLRTFPFPCHRKCCSPLKSWNSCELRERLAQLQSCQVVEWSPGLSDSRSPKVRLVQHQSDSNTVKWQNQCPWKRWRGVPVSAYFCVWHSGWCIIYMYLKYICFKYIFHIFAILKFFTVYLSTPYRVLAAAFLFWSDTAIPL